MSRHRTRHHVTLGWLVLIGFITAGCSAGKPTARHATTTSRSATATGTPVTSATATSRPVTPGGFAVPDTLPGGNFASVASPSRDGALTAVQVSLTKVATVDSPTALVARPGHPGQIFIAERAGQVLLAKLSARSGPLAIQAAPLLDLSRIVGNQGEEGLLGLAFDRTGKVLFVSYNLHNGDTRIDAVQVVDHQGGPKLTTRKNLLAVPQPTSLHKGGDLQLGADGGLYLGLGDGGGEDDPQQAAQNPNLLLGKLIRIDPTGMIQPQVRLTGLRNPWRFSFDPANGDLWIGDVGQDKTEEIDRIPPAGQDSDVNLGWSGYEGTKIYVAGRAHGPTVPPIFEISHATGACAITGGVVYRGSRIAHLAGAYLFSDLCRPGIHALRATTPAHALGAVTDERILAGTNSARQIISFGTDASSEVYVLSLNGTISRIDPA